MLLSIGMIVKNEEKYLGRCLEALQPLLQQVDSELIIVDTGSTDRTVEIAKAFTDKVYFFEWCNDFSAARNAGLKRACGEWFMGLDADEIFTDSIQEIISFFHTGAYKNYAGANFIVRNANDEQWKTYADARVARLTKIYPNTRYINSIHEKLTPIKKPMKALDAIALHYGYMQADKNFIQEKLQRNINLLKQVLEKDPADSKVYYDIGKTYALAQQLEAALQYYEQGLQYAVDASAYMQPALFYEKVRTLAELERFGEAEILIDAYFAEKKEKSIYDVEMAYIAGFLAYERKAYKKAVAAFQLYLNAWNVYQKKQYSEREVMLHEEHHVAQAYFQEAVLKLVISLTAIREYQEAQQTAKRYFKAEWYTSIYGEKMLQMEFVAMERCADFSRLTQLYQMLENSSREQEFLQRIEEAIGNEAYAGQVLQTLAQMDSLAGYIQMNRMRYQFRCGELQKETVEAFISALVEWKPIHADVLYFALYVGCDWKLLQEKVEIRALNALLVESPYLHFTDLPRVLCEVARRKGKDGSIRQSFWLTHLCFWSLMAQNGAENERLQLCGVYAEAANTCVEWLYQEEVLEESTQSLIPTPLRVGYYFYSAMQADSFQKKAVYWKAAVKVCAKMEQVTKLLINEHAERQQVEAEQAQLQKYAEIVKSNIRAMIQQGQLEQANELLTEYEKICPADEELWTMKQSLVK